MSNQIPPSYQSPPFWVTAISSEETDCTEKYPPCPAVPVPLKAPKAEVSPSDTVKALPLKDWFVTPSTVKSVVKSPTKSSSKSVQE